jgi:uncharacterized membrane protein YphA (DoxX/SURF4 family)
MIDAKRRTAAGDLVLLVLRFGMAAVFIAAAIPKIVAPDLFAGNVHNYQTLPPWGVNMLALVLPWLELLVGTSLAFGFWRRASAIVMTGLMIVFTVAYVTARARGLDIACGCFEVGAETQSTAVALVVLRDLSMLAAAAVLVRFDGGPSLLGFFQRLGRGMPAAAG